jgi:chromosome segregation ATPase
VAALPSATYSAGTAYLTVVPSFLKVTDAFKQQVRQMAAEADKDLAAAMAKGLDDVNRKAKASGQKSGRDYAGAYETEAKKALTKAWQSLPEPQPDVNLRKWDKALATVRGEMKQLGEQRIGIDIDRATFDRALDDFRQRLEALRDSASGVNRGIGFFNADQASKELQEFQRLSDEVTRRARDGGEQAGSAFTDRMTKALRDGIGKIPPVAVAADSSDAERKLADLRARMVELSDKRIGIDVDAGEAYAEIKAIAEELKSLDRRSVQVDVRTNAHEAAVGMQQLVTQAEAAGTSTQSIGSRADFSRSRLELLIALGGQFGTIVVPAAAAAAAAVGAIGTSALAALSGAGVFALALGGVSEGVKALQQYANDQAKSANSVDQANRRMASSTDQVRMAQLSLANTRRQVAEGAQDAARRVVDAEQAVGDARRAAAQDAKESAQQVADARRSVADAEADVGAARRQASIDIAEANRQVQDAQRNLTEAEQNAIGVRKDLTQAIEDAKDSMAELDVQLKRNEQDQSKAVTAQMKALADLNKLKTNPRATEIELRQAQDAYNEQTVRIEELKVKHKELADQQAKYAKDGVEADEQVIAARKRIKAADQAVGDAQAKLAREQEQRRNTEYNAQRRISDAQERVAKAQEQVARAQEHANEQSIKDQERIQAAEQAVADARRQQARQSLDGQFQLAQASNAVTQAQRSQQQAWEKTGVAGGDALDTLREKMANLSPAQQHFAKFLFGLKDEYLSLKAAAAEPLLPQLETAITMLTKYLPGVQRFIGDIGTELGYLSVRAVDALGNPVWQRFFRYIDTSAVPSLEVMFTTTENVAQGLISLFLALTPFNRPVGTGLVKLSQDFATWAERLNKTQGYRDFIDYVRDNGPRVVHFLGEVGELFIKLVEASAPLGAITLKALTLIVDVLNSIPLPALTALVIGIGAVSTGMNLLGAIMRAVKFKQQLTDIFGPKIAQMVQTYAIDTGRATEETGRFGKATATTSGLAVAARAKLAGYALSIADLPQKIGDAAHQHGLLGRSMDTVRVSTVQLSSELNGPGGIRKALRDIALAANGPGGAAAGVQVAGTKLGAFSKAAGTAATAVGTKLMSGASSLIGLLGGPWGAALTAATIALGYFIGKSIEQKQKVDTLKSALGELATTYRDLAGRGKQAGDEADEAFRDIVKNNPEMQKAVITLNKLGISFDEMVQAASSGDPSAVVKKLNDEIARLYGQIADAQNAPDELGLDVNKLLDQAHTLETVKKAFIANAAAMGQATQATQILSESSDRNTLITRAQAAAAKTGYSAQVDLINAYDRNANAITVLNGLVTTYSNLQSTAQQRAEAMRAAIENLTNATVTQTESEEALAQKTLNLREQVNQAKSAHDANARSLDLNSQTALRNRDALEDVATSIREMYIQDIAAGKPLADVTRAHNNRIAALKEEAKRLGLDKDATDKLIAAYGDVPELVKTTISMDPNSFNVVYKNLQRMQFMQMELRLGRDASKAEADWQEFQREQGRALLGRAEGGPITGPGTATSDSVLMWGSDGEWVHKAAAVDYYGEQAMAAINNMQVPREQLLPRRSQGGPVTADRLPAHAAGGRVNSQTWPFPVNVSKTWVPDRSWIEANTPGLVLGDGTWNGVLSPNDTVAKMQKFALAQRGKRYLWAAVGPDSYDCSGLTGDLWAIATGHKLYRRYMSTADMGPGRHGMVSGPGKYWTVYLGPGHTASNIAGLHAEAYGGNGTPLAIGRIGTRLSYYTQKLHLPGFAAGGPVDPAGLSTKGDRMVSFLRYGWPEPPAAVSVDDLLQSQMLTQQFDSGGWLPPGYSTVVNNTGAPEPVLTSKQWRDISELARAAGRPGGNTYQFAFRDTTLDPAQLRRIQDQEAVLARVGRAR